MATLSDDASFVAHEVAMMGRIEFMPTLLEVVSSITGMRFVAVARVTEQWWIACAVHDDINLGIKPGSWVSLDTMLCSEVRQHAATICVERVSADPHYASHPTPKQYGFESYISIPIITGNGQVFGTLCALDPLPRKVKEPNVLRTLQLFARLIASRMDLETQIEQGRSALVDAEATARLRDQFIAILGHDLRSPVQAIRMSGDVLRNRLPDGREHRMAEEILQSCDRISELINNVLDFARGQLGSGIPVTLQPSPALASRLQHVVKEIERAHPEHRIETNIVIEREVICDQERVAQLLSNLLSNAVQHGTEGRPIRVAVRSGVSLFEIIVENYGPPLPAAVKLRLFQPRKNLPPRHCLIRRLALQILPSTLFVDAAITPTYFEFGQGHYPHTLVVGKNVLQPGRVRAYKPYDFGTLGQVQETISRGQIEKLALPELELARRCGGGFFDFDIGGG